MSIPLGRGVRWIGSEEDRLRSDLKQARIDLVQVEAERDAQAGQARRTVIDLQAVTAERDRLLAIVARLCDEFEWWEASAEDPHPVWERMDPTVCWECNGGGELVRSEPMDPADAELIRRAVGGDR